NNRQFPCIGNGNCPVSKGIRCVCRHCRLNKCLAVGMDPKAIQKDRDRIGYTKRNRRKGVTKPNGRANGAGSPRSPGSEDQASEPEHGADDENSPFNLQSTSEAMDEDSGNSNHMTDAHRAALDVNYEPMLERLTQLENNFTLLLSRGDIEAYASLDQALVAKSRFNEPINVKITDPIAAPRPGNDEKMPFWRSRIITLYIDWAKTFSTFRKLPYSDKVALITNHASSYMIMCEAFRTPEHISEKALRCAGTRMDFGVKQEISDDDVPMQQQQQSHRDETPQGVVDVVISLGDVSSATHQTSIKSECESPASSRSSGTPSRASQPPASVVAAPLLAPTRMDFNMHTFFDPSLIQYGNTCGQTGVRSLVDVPPEVHYPTVGSLSGLTPVMAAMIDYVMKPFRRLNISTTEFATLQAIMFFDPGESILTSTLTLPLSSDTEGLDAASQRNVAAEQKKFLTALYKHIQLNYPEPMASDRYAAILLRIPTIRKVAAKKNQSLEIIDMFNLFTLNSLVKETALGIRQPNAAPEAAIAQLAQAVNGPDGGHISSDGGMST
ncbi:CRE-NHR-47 protein, partial [Aphelenchoides avenae]